MGERVQETSRDCVKSVLNPRTKTQGHSNMKQPTKAEFQTDRHPLRTISTHNLASVLSLPTNLSCNAACPTK